MDRPEQRAAFTQLNRDREELTKKLLGAAEFDDDMAMSYQRREYGDLSPEKMGKVRDLMNDYADRRRKIIPDGRIALPDETEKLRALDAERDGDLRRLLSPAEFEQYELRRSNTASYLSNQVQGFGATEAEYRNLFGIYRPFVDQYVLNAWTADTPEQQAARKIAEEQLQPAIKAVLGADRYADFKQAVNPDYRELNQVIGRLGLPLSVARDVAAIQQDVNQRAAALRSDTSNPDQRQAQLTALAQEANARVASALGARGADAYKLYGGQWLDTIAKAPPAPKQ
jgi:hypothetical protein